MRVALVHDFLLDIRGAERVFLTMAELWPDADVYTAVYDPRGTEFRLSHRPVHATFLQKLRPTSRSFRALLPFYPMAIESLDLRGYDLVLSSSSAWSHGVLSAPGAVHVCYCHNPFRYAWSEREATLAARGPLVRMALSPLLSNWRRWDWHAAQHVDRYLANSETTRGRIKEYWHRDATVVYPPVDTHRFTPVTREERGDYYVALGELMPHKRLDVLIRAFNALGRKLLIVGDGPEARRLHRLAGPTVTFAGRVSDAEVAGLLARCRGLVVAATEEFGIAAVETQAAGRPVIALAAGGVEETIREGVTGTFFRTLDPVHVADVIESFDDQAIDPQACASSAEQFGVAQFGAHLRSEIEKAFNAPGRTAEPREQRRPLPSPKRLRTRA